MKKGAKHPEPTGAKLCYEKKKVRATRTNGRKDSNGVFKAGYNDRSFNLENAEHVDADRSKWNV